MKLSLRNLALATVVTVAGAAMAQDAVVPTITQKWSYTKLTSPGKNESRFATGVNGKIYFNDKAAGKVMSINENGEISEVTAVTGLATGITADDAGNILVNTGWVGAGMARNFVIVPADGSEQMTLTLTLPESITAQAVHQVGRVVGDVLSEEGGFFYMTVPGTTKKDDEGQTVDDILNNFVNIVHVRNGKQVTDEYLFYDQPIRDAKDKTMNNTTSCIANPIYTAAEMYEMGDENLRAFAYRNRSNKTIYVYSDLTGQNEDMTALKEAPASNTQEGFDIFNLGGETYMVYPAKLSSGQNYSPEYQIINSKGEVLEGGNIEIGLGDGSQSFGTVTARKVSDYKVELYLYSSDGTGISAAMYEITIPGGDEPIEPEPQPVELTMGEITSETTATTATVTVNYTVANLPEGSKVHAQVMLDTAARPTLEADGEDGKATVTFTDLLPETNYGVMATIYVVDAEGNQDYSTRRQAMNAFTTAEEEVVETGVALANKSVYVYDVKVAVGENKSMPTVSYKLNGKASSVMIQPLCDGEPAGPAVEGTTEHNNKVEVEIRANVRGQVTFAITATTAEDVAEPTVIVDENTSAGKYSFYCPFGVTVNNDTDSPTFGRVIVTEDRFATASASYFSSPVNGGIGGGLYAFDPQMQTIKNSNGGNGFNANLLDIPASDAAANGVSGQFHRVQYSADGRLFMASAADGMDGIYELNPNDLEETAQKVIDARQVWGFDVYGKGNNVMITMIGQDNQNATIATYTGVGTDDQSEPMIHKALSGNDEKVGGSMVVTWNNPTTFNVSIDPDGLGFTVGQFRASPNSYENTYSHAGLDADSEIDYMDFESIAGGAGMTYNHDYTLFAKQITNSFAGGTNVGGLAIYKVTGVNEGKVPTYEKVLEMSGGIGRNLNDMAFDYANNLYIVSNSAEKVVSYQLPASIAGASSTVNSPASMAYDAVFDGIESIAVEGKNGAATYYNLNGVRMAGKNLPAGVYVKVVDGKATKVVVK